MPILQTNEMLSSNSSIKTAMALIDKRYDTLLNQRASLPRRRSASGSRSADERQIQSEASAILSLIHELPYIDASYALNIDNVQTGCRKMMVDPYKW
jgi:hypothetical protein